MSLTQQALQEEERIFQQEVTAVKQWFKKDRFSLVTRPYTAEEGKRFDCEAFSTS